MINGYLTLKKENANDGYENKKLLTCLILKGLTTVYLF